MDILDTIGNTPLIKVENIYAKLETANPSGSIKDRMAYYMIQKAEERGELRPGYTIIEVTSGNTGISFAMISVIKGYKFIAVMPENFGKEKIKIMKVFGAKVVLTPKEKGFLGTFAVAEKLAKKYKKIWLPRQFENPDNIEAHYKTTGQEILKQIDKVDAFVAGIGTGGTLMGVAKALKEKFKDVKIFGVEAAESFHQIEGISDGIIPKILDFNLIDGIIKIKSKEAIKMAKILAKKYGLLVGISSGANFLAAKKLSKKFQKVVTVFPDRGERYLELL
jgi:cysteine synthase A